MKSTLTPRSKQLSPLSEEHTHGMQFITRIREGLDTISVNRLREYTRWYWINHIRPHFFHEEKILLPYLPADHPLSQKLKDDHSYIRDLVLSLDQEAEAQSLRVLCDLLDSHIRFEETALFPLLEKELSADQLDSIYQQLSDCPVEAKEFGW